MNTLLEGISDDMQEFTTALARVRLLLEDIERANTAEIPFMFIKDLQGSLDTYESLLIKQRDRGLLLRIVSNTRLRRELEVQNALLIKSVAPIQEVLDVEISQYEKETFERMNLLHILSKEDHQVN